MNPAVQSLPDIYDSTKIYPSTGGFILNGERQGFGFLGEKLRAEMEVSREGMILFRQYQRQRRGSFLCMTAGIGMMLAASLTFDHNQNVSTVLYGASLGCMVLSIPLSVKSTNNLHRAIWTRNRDVLFR